MNLEQNVAEFRLWDQIEQESDRSSEEARWAKARLAAEAVDAGTSQRDYATEVDKSQPEINRIVRVWRKYGSDTGPNQRPPFTDCYRMIYTGTDDVEASKEVDRLRKRMPAAPDKRAEFLAEQLQADKVVAKEAVRQVLAKPSPASRAVQSAVSESEAAKRKRAAEQARRQAEREALPLPAYMSTMVVRMNEWALGLEGLYEDLAGLPEGPGRDSVGRAAAHLERAAHRWVEALRTTSPAVEVEDGNVIDMVARTA